MIIDAPYQVPNSVIQHDITTILVSEVIKKFSETYNKILKDDPENKLLLNTSEGTINKLELIQQTKTTLYHKNLSFITK